ncbi:MAG: class I SAM-dependent DNA methyltransferase [Nocardioides sp.]
MTPVEVPDFEARYREDPDPWRVGSSWYERRKLAVLMASLPRERYAAVWESGCGTGHAAAELATRCDRLLATDASATAVAMTAERCAGLPHVRTAVSALPARPVEAPVDLVVAAEFLYYLPEPSAPLETLWAACAPGGHLLVVHWRHRPEDAWRSGAEQQDLVAASAVERGATRLVGHAEPDFLLDVYEVPA